MQQAIENVCVKDYAAARVGQECGWSGGRRKRGRRKEAEV
jgi:hypothetical protein